HPFPTRRSSDLVMAHLQANPGFPLPSRVLSLEEIAKEPLLDRHTVVGVELRPMLEPVHFQPFVGARGSQVSLEVPPQVQTLTAPVGGRQQGYPDAVPARRALPVILTIQGMREYLLAEIAAVCRKLGCAQGGRAAYELSGDPAAWSAFAQAMLHRLDLHVVPVGPESAEDAAVVSHVPVPVGCPFPDAHCGQVARLQACHLPLVDAVVGDTDQPDAAIAPGKAA